ncbi:solute carrier family 4 member 11-like isoform X3 [Bolinopsis microptera]|uniref:solute carrier family 4 member 11-like isoform X3 n=1 Tax=Bolinopsis microptera TaxID=2820187 RepID=UPI003078E1F8
MGAVSNVISLRPRHVRVQNRAGLGISFDSADESEDSNYYEDQGEDSLGSRTYNALKDTEEDPGPLECHSLSYTSRKLLPMKHYHDEARAMKDIQKFLSNPIILFKLEKHTVHDIIQEMITKLASEKPRLNLKLENIISSLVEENSDYKLMEIMQGMKTNEKGENETEPSFVTILCSSNEVTENHVVMCLLHNTINLGPGAEEIHFIALVLSPLKEKKIKCAIEVSRTYSTLLADVKLRQQLKGATNPTEFAHIFELEVHRIYTEQRNGVEKALESRQDLGGNSKWCFGNDLINDLKRRAPHYLSDYTDGLNTCAGIQKIISTIMFLFFSLIIPCIAFGVLFSSLTHGIIDVRKVILSQALAGSLFSIFGGQPLLVIRATIPLTIFTKVIYSISDEKEMDFHTFYAMTGLWTSIFLVISSLTGISSLMKYCSRSTEEIFALFISIAFTVDSIKFLVHEFDYNFCFDSVEDCNVPKALLSLILLVGTVLIGCEIYNFRYSPYLTAAKRTLLADYALPVAVLLMAFAGSWLFRRVEMGTFDDKNPTSFQYTAWGEVSVGMVLGSMGLGSLQSLLIFMDQNIAANIVNNPSNRLKKGPAYHWDLMAVAVINVVLALFGLPLVHGALPHSPLHVRALADIEEKCDHGHVREIIVSVRETRVTSLVCHVLIWICALFLIPKPLNYIPIPVLYGLFVFLAIVALDDIQLWERMLLIFTEQNSYPPTSYIRKVPQKAVHTFTIIQVIQLAVLCAISFSGSPYLKMLFPALLILMIPIRSKLVPKLIKEQYLKALDGHI